MLKARLAKLFHRPARPQLEFRQSLHCLLRQLPSLVIAGAALLIFPTLQSVTAGLLVKESAARPAKSFIAEPDSAMNLRSMAQFSAQIKPFCPSGCGIPVNIGAVLNKGRRPGGGHDIEVHWQLGKKPSETFLRGISVAVEVTLQGGRIQRGSTDVAPDAKAATVAAKGLATDGDPKSYKVTISTSSESTPRDIFDQTELRPVNFRSGGGMDVLVAWRILRSSPCDSATDYDVVVSAQQFASEKQGKKRVKLSEGTALVNVPPPRIGASWDETVHLRSTYNPLNRQPILCSTSRTGEF